MNQFKINTINSFKRAKKDIEELQKIIGELNENQKWLIKKVIKLQNGICSDRKLVASKESNKVHADNCPFAKNIKAKTKQTFLNMEEAKAQGYTPCECAIA